VVDPGEGRGVGLWFIGARGSVATTALCGLLALRAGLTRPAGCVSEILGLPAGALPTWDEITVGGHDIVDTPLDKRAEQLTDAGVIPRGVLTAVHHELTRVDAELRFGYDAARHRGPLASAARRLTEDIEAFRERHGTARVVVVNVSTTEPPVPHRPEHDDLDLLSEAMTDEETGDGTAVLPPSSLAAYAALAAGCPYVDFTPSPGIRLPALLELARRSELPYAGADGKTGETLLRTVLAPMFAARALEVTSWSGTNLLGGGDGANLGDPARVAGKLATKKRGLTELLGGDVTAPLHIDYVPDLGERKVAWDHVSFEGFLGAQMSLQFTWSGYDSSLAAPLVLDLTRLVAAAHAAGRTGPLGALAFFFKDPIGSAEHRFDRQVSALARWAAELGEGR
jgi:myo-inositol-1-phosphate synthase